jgi:hypothetical protein
MPAEDRALQVKTSNCILSNCDPTIYHCGSKVFKIESWKPKMIGRLIENGR